MRRQRLVGDGCARGRAAPMKYVGGVPKSTAGALQRAPDGPRCMVSGCGVEVPERVTQGSEGRVDVVEISDGRWTASMSEVSPTSVPHRVRTAVHERFLVSGSGLACFVVDGRTYEH